MIQRLKGQVSGLEDKAESYITQDTVEKTAKKYKEAIGKEILAEIDPMVADAEREGQAAHTLDVIAKDGRAVKVIYVGRSKTIKPEDLDMTKDRLGPMSDEVLVTKTTVKLEGAAAERFLAECEKIDLYADVDTNITVTETTALCGDFLQRKIALRREFPDHDEQITKVANDHLVKPTFKIVKPKAKKASLEV